MSSSRYWSPYFGSHSSYGGYYGGWDNYKYRPSRYSYYEVGGYVGKDELKKFLASRRDAVQFTTKGDLFAKLISSVKRKAGTENLPTDRVGYDTYSYAKDVNAAFKNERPKGLKQVAKDGFEANCLLDYELNTFDLLPSQARTFAAQKYKFLHRFGRSELRKQFLEYASRRLHYGTGYVSHSNDIYSADEIANEATIQFFNSGMGGAEQDTQEELAKMDSQQLASHGILPGTMSDGVQKFITRTKLAKYIKKDWDFAGEHTRQIRLTDHPAEDVDFRPIRQYQEVIHAPMEAFMDRRVLGWKLANRSLTVRQYSEYIPGPPKRYMLLIDESGSMCCGGETFNGIQITGADWAIAIAIAIAKASKEGDNRIDIGLFDTGARILVEHATPQEAVSALEKVGFQAGGTDIGAAIAFANKQHKKDPIEALILITDGDGDTSTAPLGYALYTVFTGEYSTSSGWHLWLMNHSKAFMGIEGTREGEKTSWKTLDKASGNVVGRETVK